MTAEPHPQEYVITEEELLDITSYIYHEDEEPFIRVARKIRSRPVHQQSEQEIREKVLDEVELELRYGKCPPGKDNFNCGDSDCGLCVVDYVRSKQGEP